MPLIEIANLQKVAGNATVVDIESLFVEAGEAAAVIGPEGSGRDELLKLLLGQSRPTAGTVRLAGLDPYSQRDLVSQRTGVLFAQDGLYERQSARQNLVFHCRLRGLPASRADEVLTQVGLADRASMPAGKLSPTLKRRLAFGRAILNKPAVLLLVNPFAGSDTSSGALLDRLIRQETARGAAVLIVANEGAGLVHLCRAIYSLENGRLHRTGQQVEDHRLELPFKVPARLEGQVALVNLPDILYASAEEGLARLHTVQGDIPSHLTLSELEERLVPHGFFRAHRGYLVNLQRVKSIVPYTRDSFTLVLDDAPGTEIPLSKTAAKELREKLGY